MSNNLQKSSLVEPLVLPYKSFFRPLNDKSYGLPSHLSEETFRRFEPFITEAVKRAPEDTSFVIPDSLAPTTFVARLRDATLSVKKFEWSPTTINMEKLWSFSSTMVWAYDHPTKLVWYREKQRRGRPNQLTPEINTHARALSIPRWNSCTDEELNALCILLHAGRLVGPYILSGPVNPAIQADILSRLDVSFVHDPVNNETIIN